VHQAQHTHANGDEKQRLGQLESRNQDEPPIVVALLGRDLGWGVDSFLCYAMPGCKWGPIDTLNDDGWFSQPLC
jgi:hypothetical protein